MSNMRDPGLIPLHAVADGVIAFAYFLIPSLLLLRVRRRHDLEFRWAYILFGVFILAFGATYALGVVTLWKPVYRLDGLIKVVTALASVGTAAALVRLVLECLSNRQPSN